MKIGVLSDTHGDLANIRKVIKRVTDVAMWLHAGDCSQDADYLRSLVTVPVCAVRGNCDGHTPAKIDEFIEADNCKIWLTHGHRYGVKQGVQELVNWGKCYEANVVVYGHTHIADNHWCEGMLLFNPGSNHGNRCACGILQIANGQIVGQMMDCND